MRILHLSDTHGCHRQLKELPEVDVLIHSGDFTMAGSETEAIDFMNWLCDLPYNHKIFICGNHDECLYGANIEGLDRNVHYLNNSGIEIEGFKFYGVPMFMRDSRKRETFYSSIPEDTDILITHAPPFGIMDFDGRRNYGSEVLLQKVSGMSLKLHLFGHIHNAHGIQEINGIIFSNGAIMNDSYRNLQTPNLIEF